ncbi:MAG: hypothetical protein KKC76_02690 [Proteobacteria bacterium]|nr:hypothetical protein [Pseudomonadota bacterium]MBU4295635.1 hypothetical protein [Pseudomonadota bacterium]MCG2746826.1 hypothetical protein [Desulfobulbaceae bacterium]
MDQKKIFPEETSKRKHEQRSGSEIAEELSRLAAEIADGGLIINGEKLPVGDSFSFVMKKQLKRGMVSCEFFLQTRLAAKEGSPPVLAADGKEKVRKCPASGGKNLKKDISRLWKEVVKQVGAENALPRELAAELRKKCDDYHLCAHSQWFEAWCECANVVKACISAAEKGDFAAARQNISEVNHLTKECHRLYK